MNQAKSMGKPMYFITDRLSSYNEVVKTMLNESTHIPTPPMSINTNNNLIYMFILHYNFIKLHGSLKGSTPAEVADFNTNNFNKKN